MRLYSLIFIFFTSCTTAPHSIVGDWEGVDIQNGIPQLPDAQHIRLHLGDDARFQLHGAEVEGRTGVIRGTYTYHNDTLTLYNAQKKPWALYVQALKANVLRIQLQQAQPASYLELTSSSISPN